MTRIRLEKLSGGRLVEDRRPTDYAGISDIKSCHLRYLLHVIDGCPLSCSYCYAPHLPTITVRSDYDFALDEELDGIDHRFPLYCGSSGDIFHPRLREAVDYRALFSISDRAFLFIVTRYPGELLARYRDAGRNIDPTRVKIYVTHNTIEQEQSLSKFEAMKVLNAAGLYAALLYKPLIPGVNDDDARLKSTLSSAAEHGVTEVCSGFLLTKTPEEHRRLGGAYDLALHDHTYVPSVATRVAAVEHLRQRARECGLSVSLCHGFVDAAPDDNQCLCRTQRWG